MLGSPPVEASATAILLYRAESLKVNGVSPSSRPLLWSKTLKIQKVSDVHCEWHNDMGERWANEFPIVGDVIVLAGDVVTHHNLIKVLSRLCERAGDVDILFVCGNHEYFGSERGKIHNKLQKLQNRYPHFHWLNNNTVRIDGRRFLGTTLWWKTPVSAVRQALEFKNLWCDATSILGYKNWINEAATKARKFLWTETQRDDVIITHHAPSVSLWGLRRVHKEVWSDRFYFWYATMDKLILEKAPALWLYGHTHQPVDTMIGETRIVHCPHGYVYRGPCNPNVYQIIEL